MCKRLIMVAGKSGAGKTHLLNTFTTVYSDYYMRPISYTSRAKRENEKGDEYIFSTADEMLYLRDQQMFANFDYNYGNYYAMTKQSIEDLFAKGKHAIKEIHPQNFKKIKEIYPDAITVLIRDAADTSEYREDRRDEDERYYQSLSDEMFDIIHLNDRTITVERNAYYLHKKLQSYLKYEGRFPSQTDIDSANSLGYNTIAMEFTEDKRITTHNFHQLSEEFFRHVMRSRVENGMKVLEIGPGRGWLRNTFNWPDVDYHALELSHKMAELTADHARSDKWFVSSVARNMIESEQFQCVFGSLGDPYFYPLALSEVYRLTANDGYFVFSVPAADWSRNLREHDIERTTFVSSQGENIDTFSFSLTELELHEILQDCGFEEINLASIKAARLFQENAMISPAITKALERKKCTADCMDIITVGICRKRVRQ